MIYIDLLLVALVTIYIVDLSGFTQSWRALVAKFIGVSEKALKPLPPFDCGLCMTWWVCIIYALCCSQLNIYTLAYSALLSFLSVPLGQVLMVAREWLISLTNKLMPKC